jgi:plastocyanin
VLSVLAAGTGTTAEAPSRVSIRLFQFRPASVQVPAGTRVTWTNQDDITHTITSGTPDQRDGRFSLPLADQGATATIDFTQPGVYPYFCDRHQSMRGEIRVNP